MKNKSGSRDGTFSFGEMSKSCTGCQRCGNITLCCQLCYLNLCSSGFTFHLLSAETNVGFYPVVAKQVFKWLWEEVCPVNQFRNLRLLDRKAYGFSPDATQNPIKSPTAWPSGFMHLTISDIMLALKRCIIKPLADSYLSLSAHKASSREIYRMSLGL